MIRCAHSGRFFFAFAGGSRPNTAAFGSHKPRFRESGKVGELSVRLHQS